MSQIQINSNYDNTDFPGTTFTLDSLTVPNQALTIKEMLIRYNNGQSVPIDSAQEWADHPVPMPEFNDLTDLDDAKAFVSDLEARIKNVKADIKKKEKEAKTAPKIDEETTPESTTSTT